MKIGRMLSLSWYGGADSREMVAKQVAGIHSHVEDGVWLCVEREGGSPNPATQLIGLNMDQCEELELSQLFFEECLLPLFHHLRKGFSFNYRHYAAYRKWNKGLAEGLASLYREGDVLWLHDAHWIPLARYLKELQPNLPIGISFPTSFCSTEVFKTLPVAEELLDDLFYFDLVTFSREADIHNLVDAMINLRGAITLADKRLKKDNQILKAAAYAPMAFVDRDALGYRHGEDCFGMSPGDKLVLSIDVPAWFSNLANRCQGYELFLKDNPALAKDIVFGSLVTPFAINEERVRSATRRWKCDLDELNDHWRSYSRKPFRMAFSQKLNCPPELLFRSARVFVDLSFGCYSACNHSDFWWAQNPEDPAVLVVSSLALDGNDLPGAIVVHPLDILGIADAVKQALLMPLSERKLRFEQLGNTFRTASPERRRAKFVLDVVEQARKNRQLSRVPKVKQEPLKSVSH